MIQGSLVRRYARALLTLAQDQGQVDAVRAEVAMFAEILKGSPLLANTLCNSTLALRDRKAVMAQVAENLKASAMFRNFLLLILEKDRMILYPEMAKELEAQADEQSGRVKAKVRVAKSLAPEAQKDLVEALSKSTGKKIELELEVDPSVIGGISTQIGNTIFDGTVATQLEKMKRKLLQKNTEL